MNTIRITTPQNIELEYDLASLGERLLAFLLDALIVMAYLTLLSLVIFTMMSSRQSEIAYMIFALPVVFYNLLSELILNGQTVGKRVLKIKVISLDGGSASFSQYLLRWVFRLIDIFISSGLVALVCIALTERAQRLGDLVAGTTLVRTVPRTSIQETLYIPQPVPDYAVRFPEVDRLTDNDMQLVKEVVISVRKSGNTMLALRAAEKIEQTLQISRGQMEPMNFLGTILSDYNFLTSKR